MRRQWGQAVSPRALSELGRGSVRPQAIPKITLPVGRLHGAVRSGRLMFVQLAPVGRTFLLRDANHRGARFDRPGELRH